MDLNIFTYFKDTKNKEDPILLLMRVKPSASFTDDLNNTGFHQYWIQTPMYSTAKDFIQQKVNQTVKIHITARKDQCKNN
jgi:hypothetical protein